MLADLARVGAFAASIHRYLRADVSDGAIEARLRANLATRGERLRALLDDAVFQRPGSPYLALLRHAGVERGDIATLLREHGVEGALTRLRGAGVHVTAEELKGRVPVRRGSLVLDVRPEDFDNPLRGLGLSTLTGGSSGRPLRVGLRIDDLIEDIQYVRPSLAGAGLIGSPLVIWRGVPPNRSGLRCAFRALRSGLPLYSWWSPTAVGLRVSPRDRLALGLARAIARGHGDSIPRPRYAPLDDPLPVLADLARLAAAGRRPVLDATAGAAARLCRVAAERGVGLHGATIRTGGEPLSDAKAELMREVGARPICYYQAHEIGRIGVACHDPAAPDDVHVALGRVALVEGEPATPGARLLLTGLSRDSQRILLNADIGDAAVLVRRACGCPLGAAGLDLHAHSIRAVVKVTADGTNILHDELLELVERTLPERFGGGPSDYQIVETEEEGITRVLVVMSPRIGEVVEREVIETVLRAVGDGPRWREMTASVWADGSTLRLVRREPIPAQSGKLQVFHREHA